DGMFIDSTICVPTISILYFQTIVLAAFTQSDIVHRPPSHVEVHPDYPDENIRIHPAREDEADEQRLPNAVGVAHDFLVLVEFLKGIYSRRTVLHKKWQSNKT